MASYYLDSAPTLRYGPGGLPPPVNPVPFNPSIGPAPFNPSIGPAPFNPSIGPAPSINPVTPMPVTPIPGPLFPNPPLTPIPGPIFPNGPGGACLPGYKRVTCYEESNDLVTSLWGLLVVAVVAFVVFCPLMFRATNTIFGGYLGTNNLALGGTSPNWIGWLLHVIVGSLVGYGLTVLLMKLLKKPPVRSSKCEKK